MSTAALKRRNIRTKASLEREGIAKRKARQFLISRGFEVLSAAPFHNRYVFEVTNRSGERKTLWFKLGWTPDDHGSSAVQIQMIKKDAGGRRPSELTDSEVTKIVVEKVARAASAGVTDILLFSLDAKNIEPIACLLLPIKQAEPAFADCMKADRRNTRNGASPVFWIVGKTVETRNLARIVAGYASNDLVQDAEEKVAPIEDAYNDLIPQAQEVGREQPERQRVEVLRFARDPLVREIARRRANGRCELCGRVGFLMDNGERYVETHHILPLGEDGPDTPQNVIALCADDHRAAHFAQNRVELADRMRAILAERVARPSSAA